MDNKKSEKKNLYLFILITFTFSWLFWIPKALIAQGLMNTSIISNVLSFLNLGAFGPLVAAFYLTYHNNGKLGVIKLLKRGIDFSFNKKWLIPILLLIPLIAGAALLISTLLGSTLPSLPLIYAPHLIMYWFVYMFFLGGPLQEEFGWRGYALDRLQSRYTAFTASIILGFIWAIWHLPLNLTSDVGPQYSLLISTIIGSIITLCLVSILFTWIYNNTNKSILAVMLFHASINLSTFKLFPVFESQNALPYYTLLILISVITVLIIWGRKKLVR
ncbi:MAG: CPBP family intramembrane metalloprotease [Candidatus Lokiarchaeota archaeon]|nr:CPBP family intramembrane metalloprotease [Candidatus Lokiarchaeota archaeon]